MSRTEQLETQFRALHGSTYQEYSQTNQQARADLEFQLSHDKDREEQERKAIYRVSHMSADDYARVDRERQEAIRGHVQQVRSQLIARPSKEAQSSKRRAALVGLATPQLTSIPIYASSVMSEEAGDVADIPGEHGNPWVLPWNPDQVKISQTFASADYGLCGWARAYRAPVIADFWFAFLADTTGIWNFLAFVNAFGFYLLNANRGFLLCRDSRVTFDASLNAYQYFWFGEKKFPILNVESDTGFKSGFCDEYGEYDYQAFLRADTEYFVFFRVRMTIFADAYGTGAWSEINFKDGDANFIKPLLLVASHS